MSAAGLLLAACLLVPLAMAAGCLARPFRHRAPGLLWLAPVPALLAALLLPTGTAASFPVPFRMTLALDQPGAILLGGAALLWSAASGYAASYLRAKPGMTSFCVWWLLTLAGSLGVFIVSDIASFYLLFTLASLSAYGLVAHEQTAAAKRAGVVYMVLALLGEAFILFGFVMLAAGNPDPNPLIRDAVATLSGSAMRDGIVLMLILGFALKMGLVPLHIWLPLAHPAAPMPASAVLSGVLVKAGVIGLIRFLPFDTALPFWGTLLATAGILTAYGGVALGVAQRRPKTILAYSTVSQMGLVAAIMGAGLAAGDPSAPGLAAYYGVHHTLVKGGLFLAIGVALASGGRQSRPVLWLTGLLALSLAGLPMTSGALAKLAVKPMLGYGVLSLAVSLAAAGSTMLMLHFIAVMLRETDGRPEAAAPQGEVMPFLAIATASLAIPWWLYPALSGEPFASAWTIGSLWKLVWPMLLGGAVFVLARRFESFAGRVPEGDILVLAERQAPLFACVPAAIERLDASLRRWPLAGLVLVGLVILLGGRFLLPS
ncbi:MAG TPA: complex I subunit 5 family protein [Bosea sp. (in: a-proteobacteria)]|jgi:formate hydrogenlyase subunit 3/multisubunit Na+/H+ antiporter MnhD subunit|uniref:complex I subunit 5 family protein n=1 Tax=Bosea sp. (in: a-proteobacteria) TaxID=1871050 RepID=UPI002E148717|nr:complex I subunit 5 family protein [Bosea sp. (in: a-proteobacteria)]